MVVPNGPDLARSRSTWIHWWSPVASAKRLICSWSIVCQSLCPRCFPTMPGRSARAMAVASLLLIGDPCRSVVQGPAGHRGAAPDRLDHVGQDEQLRPFSVGRGPGGGLHEEMGAAAGGYPPDGEGRPRRGG